jgi:hypothetical protein
MPEHREEMRFEDLDVWKRAMKLSTDIYRELKNLKDYGFKDQITRSGLSIPSNIAEGFERTSNKESIRELCTTSLVVLPAQAGIQETIDNTGFRFSPE